MNWLRSKNSPYLAASRPLIALKKIYLCSALDLIILRCVAKKPLQRYPFDVRTYCDTNALSLSN